MAFYSQLVQSVFSNISSVALYYMTSLDCKNENPENRLSSQLFKKLCIHSKYHQIVKQEFSESTGKPNSYISAPRL